jgi:hypothetical protein
MSVEEHIEQVVLTEVVLVFVSRTRAKAGADATAASEEALIPCMVCVSQSATMSQREDAVTLAAR